MRLKLGTIDHRCMAVKCEGEVLSQVGRCKVLRKVTLTYPNGARLAFGTKEQALAFAASEENEVEE